MAYLLNDPAPSSAFSSLQLPAALIFCASPLISAPNSARLCHDALLDSTRAPLRHCSKSVRRVSMRGNFRAYRDFPGFIIRRARYNHSVFCIGEG
ncbi:hypothetical protein BJX70DRAFT_63971 [Aspergillus crustosus]